MTPDKQNIDDPSSDKEDMRSGYVARAASQHCAITTYEFVNLYSYSKMGHNRRLSGPAVCRSYHMAYQSVSDDNPSSSCYAQCATALASYPASTLLQSRLRNLHWGTCCFRTPSRRIPGCYGHGHSPPFPTPFYVTLLRGKTIKE
jgi:hypothetical protein